MADRSRNLIIEFTLDSNCLAIFLLSSIEVALPFKRFSETLVRQADEALFITHLIHSQAACSIFTSHSQFSNRFIVLANLHIFLREALAITLHFFERF